VDFDSGWIIYHGVPPIRKFRSVANVGDFDRSQAAELKAAGVNGAYHVLRLREGTDTNADIRVSTTNAMVTVRFTPDIVRRLPGDCLPVLQLDGPERTLTEAEYGQFLNDFHAYLLLTYGEGGHVPKK
jgi:hypothetical protein